MAAETGNGMLAYVMVLVVVLLLAYPGYWAKRIWNDPGIRRRHEPAGFIVGTLVAAVLTVPLSLLDIGWLLVPAVILLVTLTYAFIHAEVVGHYRSVARPEPLHVFLAFALPLLALSVMVLIAVQGELAASHADQGAGIQAVQSSVILSFASLAIAPPLLTSFVMLIAFVRRRLSSG